MRGTAGLVMRLSGQLPIPQSSCLSDFHYYYFKGTPSLSGFQYEPHWWATLTCAGASFARYFLALRGDVDG